MNYHNIEHDSQMNGEGMRVVLFVSGCTHNCKGCQNPQTHDFNSGVPFDEDAMSEIREQLKQDYISGLTLSGGDPLDPRNVKTILDICSKVKAEFPHKNIWCYTGFTYTELEDISKSNPCYTPLLFSYNCLIDTLVDGRFVEKLADVNYPHAGSTNQRIIDAHKSFVYNQTK